MVSTKQGDERRSLSVLWPVLAQCLESHVINWEEINVKVRRAHQNDKHIRGPHYRITHLFTQLGSRLCALLLRMNVL